MEETKNFDLGRDQEQEEKSSIDFQLIYLSLSSTGNGSFYHSLYVWDWDISTYAMQDRNTRQPLRY